MAIEPKRGCGYRQAGGIYLVADKATDPCDRLPLRVGVCPHCHSDVVKHSRTFQWVATEAILSEPCATLASKLLASEAPLDESDPNDIASHISQVNGHCGHCPLCLPETIKKHYEPNDKVGFLWVSDKYYSVSSFIAEAQEIGISRRVSQWPRDLVPGKSLVLLGHREVADEPCACLANTESLSTPLSYNALVERAKNCKLCHGSGVAKVAGVFHVFVPCVEVLVTPAMREEQWARSLEECGAVLIEVPDDDPDHAPAKRERTARRKSMDTIADQQQPERN